MLIQIHSPAPDHGGPPAPKPDAQTGRHDQASVTDGRSEQVVVDNPTGRGDQTSGQVNQTGKADVHSTRPKAPASSDDLPCHIIRNPIHTAKQKALWRYLVKIGDHHTTTQKIAADTGIPHGTVRQILRHFAVHQVIGKWPFVDRAIRGITIRLNREWLAKADVHFSRQKEPSEIGPDREILNLEKNLSLLTGIRSMSHEEFRSLYPLLTQIGFGASQLRQVADLRHKLADDLGNLFQSLDHAEAELESFGHLVAKDGAPPANPCNYLFKSLARRGGYYRAPTGYRSPDQVAHEDRARRANTEREAMEKADRAECALWKQKLSAQERADLTHRQLEVERCRGRAIRGELVGGGEWLLEIYWNENIRRSPCTSLPTTAPGKETL